MLSALSPGLTRPRAALGLDARAVSLLVLLAAIALLFHGLSGGLFLTPRNLYNLVVQSSVVAILACGMSLVIATRNIDLSVGSVLGFVGMTIAILQIETLPAAPWAWPLTVLLGLGLGALIGAWHGFWIAWLGVPSFVVTLGGLLVFRGAAFEVAQGRTIAPFQPGYQILGGGLDGALGETASWAILAAIIALYAIGETMIHRRQTRLGSATSGRGRAARVLLVAAAATGFVLTMNAYTRPGTDIGRGVPLPALILLAVLLAVEFVARATPFGRYVYAIGGNAEAARLTGIPTRAVVLRVYVLMGLLCGVAAVVATARLNAGTAATGELLELSAIAAAVIGGVSLAGGRGTATGAVVGAFIIQSLDSGMVLIGSTSSQRLILIGLVLTVAVVADQALARGRAGASP